MAFSNTSRNLPTFKDNYYFSNVCYFAVIFYFYLDQVPCLLPRYSSMNCKPSDCGQLYNTGVSLGSGTIKDTNE